MEKRSLKEKNVIKNLNVGQRIAAGFAGVILIAVALGIFAYSRVGLIQVNATSIVGHKLPTIYFVGQVQKHAEANAGLVLRHVVAKESEEMARIATAVQNLATSNTRCCSSMRN